MFYFCKMQGTGNDFVIVDYITEKFEYSFKLLSEFLCNRHYGVGADGVIIIDKSEIADFKMRIFNSDGSEAEMCGNGIRCFAKYVYEHGFIKKERFDIETMAGIKNVELSIEGKTVVNIKVEIGEPVFELEKIPVIYDNLVEDYTENISDKTQENDTLNAVVMKDKNCIRIYEKEFYAICLGNPHVVCFVEDVDNTNVKEIGKKVENSKYFLNKTNVEFVQIINENEIKVRVWERGVGETLSCGTGACAAAIVSHLQKSTNCDINVDLRGGNLKVKYDKESNKVYLEGEAKEVFSGSLII